MLLLIFPVIFLFGVLRLDTRQLMWMAMLAIACHGALIGSMLLWRHGSFDLRVSLVRWAVLGAVLVWFALMGDTSAGCVVGRERTSRSCASRWRPAAALRRATS